MQALVPLAHWIGERRVLPSVTAGWQFIQQPDTDHFDLIFSKPIQETALQGLANAQGFPRGKQHFHFLSPLPPSHIAFGARRGCC